MGMKGHPQSNCGGGGSAAGGGWMMKNKMVMVALVVLVGVMGVMVIQKVKDRRLFNLVIKDKDRQILSLNLLLQKERQYAKENKRKNLDLNAMLYSLRTQKMDLDNKIMEMRSTIGSMRDEYRVLELAVDEKQKEIKHKESEIKDLKSNLQTPPHEANLTSKVTTIKLKERSSWFGQSSSKQKPNHEEIKNPDIQIQTPKDEDLENVASSKDHNDSAKIEMHNTTNSRLATKNTRDSEENSNGLAMKGRRFFIGATEGQRDKSNGQNKKEQMEMKAEEGPTEVTRFKSNRTKGEAYRMNEAETEVDTNTSRNGSEEDQDYKEETEE